MSSRLWAASGQAALESSRMLVIAASATATSILKNLVLPGIGHFTLLDPALTSPADAGNNFFLNARESIGKPRASEAVPLLQELNESVDGAADVRALKDVLATPEGQDWVRSFSLVITHNLEQNTLETLSKLLWEDVTGPPLIVVRSSGFLADFYIQYHEHCVIESHSETTPSLRLTNPFPALEQWALEVDYSKLDPTDHGHIPFAVILVKEAENWKAQHDGKMPQTYAEKQAFKAAIAAHKVKIDEENFEEAEAQAFRLWSEKPVPLDVSALFDLPPLNVACTITPSPSSNTNADPGSPNADFHALLCTLKAFVVSEGALPLTASLPDMKTDTVSYVRLQKMYRERAGIENAMFKDLLRKTFPAAAIAEDTIDAFVKNAHHVKLLRGRPYNAFDQDKAALASSLEIFPRETATHIALSALSALISRGTEPTGITDEAIKQEVISLVGQGVTLPPQLDDAIGEITRAPAADMPNVAAFLGGMVAQEAIKMITRQYVPIAGHCVVDLVDSWTGVVGGA
ncbi:hypothetical protein EIP86_003210 [Pleurotus ostreatoroseus]|nr:hypothetical protein EIP86_003210 [Pleurotus ostreatoroseus]